MEQLASFAADPDGSAILLDVDGTLAPIVLRPELARIPPRALALLERLAAVYAVVACVSGRRAAEVRRLTQPAPVTVIGTHGMERDDGFVPEVAAYAGEIARAATLLEPVAAAAGGWVEDKVVALNVHFRESSDPAAAAAALRPAADDIARSGLRVRWGRMSLEVLPPVNVDKGTAIADLLRTTAARRSLYAGDDATDIAALRAVDLPIAVRSPEAPAELLEAAAIVVDGPDGLLDLLSAL